MIDDLTPVKHHVTIEGHALIVEKVTDKDWRLHLDDDTETYICKFGGIQAIRRYVRFAGDHLEPAPDLAPAPSVPLLAEWSVTTTRREKAQYVMRHFPRCAFVGPLRLPTGATIYVGQGGHASTIKPWQRPEPPAPRPDRRVVRDVWSKLQSNLLHYGDTLRPGDEMELAYGIIARLDWEHQEPVRAGAQRSAPLVVFHRSAPQAAREVARAYSMPGGTLFRVRFLSTERAQRAIQAVAEFAGVKPVDERLIAASLGINLAPPWRGEF